MDPNFTFPFRKILTLRWKIRLVCPQTLLSKIPYHLGKTVWISVTWNNPPTIFFYGTHSSSYLALHTAQRNRRLFFCQNTENWIFWFLLLLCFTKMGGHTYTYLSIHSGKEQNETSFASFQHGDKLELKITFGISNWPAVTDLVEGSLAFSPG